MQRVTAFSRNFGDLLEHQSSMDADTCQNLALITSWSQDTEYDDCRLYLLLYLIPQLS